MIIHDEIAKKYFSGADSSDYKQCWVFHKIEDNQYLFEEPSRDDEKLVQQVYDRMLDLLKGFIPLNKNLFLKLFPKYKVIMENTHIMLMVGAPDPYDAMVISYKGREYVVYDLVRLASYVEAGHNLEDIIRKLLTHEFAHRCLHEHYPACGNLSYIDRLNYMTFDEGFAHLLAYADSIEEYDFSSKEYSERYIEAKAGLKRAIRELDPETQGNWLMAGDSGKYWGKFASISGKLYLAKNIGELISIYNNGWNSIVSKILKT